MASEFESPSRCQQSLCVPALFSVPSIYSSQIQKPSRTTCFGKFHCQLFKQRVQLFLRRSSRSSPPPNPVSFKIRCAFDGNKGPSNPERWPPPPRNVSEGKRPRSRDQRSGQRALDDEVPPVSKYIKRVLSSPRIESESTETKDYFSEIIKAAQFCFFGKPGPVTNSSRRSRFSIFHNMLIRLLSFAKSIKSMYSEMFLSSERAQLEKEVEYIAEAEKFYQKHNYWPPGSKHDWISRAWRAVRPKVAPRWFARRVHPNMSISRKIWHLWWTPTRREVPTKASVLAMLFGICMIALPVTAQILKVQVFQASFLEQQARAQQFIRVDRFAPRRTIIDSRGTVLALDQPVYDVYAHPRYFNIPVDDIARKLGAVLEKEPEELLGLFGRYKSGIPVGRRVREEQARQVGQLRIDGVDLVQHPERSYPQNELGAEVIGYCDWSHNAQAGIELSQDKVLKNSVEALSEMARTGYGSLLPEVSPSLFRVDDNMVQLTLDLRLQRQARQALIESMDKFSAKRGTVIVLDVNNGEIKTLVTVPTYNPNEFFKAPLELFKCWPVTDMFEPGSTFKPINVAIALETGAIKANDVFYDEGHLTVGGWPVYNVDYKYDKTQRLLSVSEVLQRSSNVGMVHIMQRVAPKNFYKWLQKLGIGSRIQTDMPFITGSLIKPLSVFTQYPIEQATTAFGQGFAITPIKLAQLHAALANGGNLVNPHVVKGLVNGNGELLWAPQRDQPVRVFSQETAKTIVGFMEKVVEQGTGKGARLPGVRIAGKTGTAQKAVGRAYGNAFVTSFVAIYPADQPRYVIVCMVDEPMGRDAFGSTVAVPVVKSTLQALISVEQQSAESLVAPPPLSDFARSGFLNEALPKPEPSPQP